MSEPISQLTDFQAIFGKDSTNYVAMATRVNHGRLTKIIYLLQPKKPLLDARISETSCTYVKLQPILSQISFSLQRESVGVKFDWQHSMAHPRKSPYRRKNLTDISYTSRIIANFVPNFVAMATGVIRGKMQLAAFNGPSLKTPYRRKNFAKIFYTS